MREGTCVRRQHHHRHNHVTFSGHKITWTAPRARHPHVRAPSLAQPSQRVRPPAQLAAAGPQHARRRHHSRAVPAARAASRCVPQGTCPASRGNGPQPPAARQVCLCLAQDPQLRHLPRRRRQLRQAMQRPRSKPDRWLCAAAPHAGTVRLPGPATSRCKSAKVRHQVRHGTTFDEGGERAATCGALGRLPGWSCPTPPLTSDTPLKQSGSGRPRPVVPAPCQPQAPCVCLLPTSLAVRHGRASSAAAVHNDAHKLLLCPRVSRACHAPTCLAPHTIVAPPSLASPCLVFLCSHQTDPNRSSGREHGEEPQRLSQLGVLQWPQLGAPRQSQLGVPQQRQHRPGAAGSLDPGPALRPRRLRHAGTTSPAPTGAHPPALPPMGAMAGWVRRRRGQLLPQLPRPTAAAAVPAPRLPGWRPL